MTVWIALMAFAVEAADLGCEELFRIPSMGTVFELQIVKKCDQERVELEPLLARVRSRLEEIESSMSLYQPETPISRLNRNGGLAAPDGDLKAVLTAALAISEKTEGAFDPTVWPILQTIQRAFRETNKPPQQASLDRQRELVNWKNVQVDAKGIKFQKPGMGISLDGIAKGYAVDAVSEIVEGQGSKNYLLNFSGNMRWLGNRKDGKPWNVRGWDPVRLKTFPLPVLKQGAVASSGVDINAYSLDKAWHHLIDPVALRPAKTQWGMTIVGPSAMICDALSKLFVVSPLRARNILEAKFPGYHFWSVDRNNTINTNL